jgi:hypothetical protein
VTDTTGYRGDPEGLLPKETEAEKVVEVQEDYCIWINGLTKAQFDGLVEALSPAGKPLGRTTRFALRLCTTMVFVAGCLWVVAQIVTHFPTR